MEKPLLGGKTVEPVFNVFRGVRGLKAGGREVEGIPHEQPPRDGTGSSSLELADASLEYR